MNVLVAAVTIFFITNLCSLFIGYEITNEMVNAKGRTIAIMPCPSYIKIKGPAYGFDDWYEGAHQGGSSGGDGTSISTAPPPDPPAIIHHKDEVTINLAPPNIPATLDGINGLNVLKLPEFPNAKPNSKRAAFDNWEDNLEINFGIYGQAFGGGYPGVTRAIFLGRI